MSLQTLDRTQWSFAEALAHVQTVTVARHAVEAAKLPPKPVPAHHSWNPPQNPAVAWKAEGQTELLVALRDGDLIAQGRYTEERTHGWGYGDNTTGFGLHSGRHSSILPEQSRCKMATAACTASRPARSMAGPGRWGLHRWPPSRGSKVSTAPAL